MAEELPGTRAEIAAIEASLEARGYPCRTLYGEAAHAGRLIRLVEETQPAVLHLAAHGMASDEYLDACALILAADPDNAAAELLTFRRIRGANLSSVELAVLSACSSSVGSSSRSAGLEGLVWVFLQAGVSQVIASRYPVRDAAAARLMDHLYGHLPVHPPAKALQLTGRDLAREHMPIREIAAWGVWSGGR
jgi:CHAT domain-containing protein